MGSRALSRSAPSLWNSLPPDTSDTVSTFKSHLTYSEWITPYQTNHIITLLPTLYCTLLHCSHPRSSILPKSALVDFLYGEDCGVWILCWAPGTMYVIASSYLFTCPHLHLIGSCFCCTVVVMCGILECSERRFQLKCIIIDSWAPTDVPTWNSLFLMVILHSQWHAMNEKCIWMTQTGFVPLNASWVWLWHATI